MIPSSVIGDDLSLADGLESVKVEQVGTTAVATVAGALRRTLSWREAAASDGKYLAGDTVWHLPVTLLPARPSPGDRVIDVVGRYWTVLEVMQETLASRWRVIARELSIARQLSNVVEIQKATVLKGRGGAAERTWELFRAGVRARIQPRTTIESVHDGIESENSRFTIYLAEQIPLDSTHRIVADDGTVYQVLGCESANRIDRLFVVNAVRFASDPP
jgi:hypothetical protein